MPSDKLKYVVIIPARGGSKRLPRKNILDLAGKPLVAHSIEAAQQVKIFDRIIVSTDDPQVKKVAERYSDVLIDDRRSSLAGDQVKVVDVIRDICLRPEICEYFDVVAMMLPTAPFRKVNDIKKQVAMLNRDVDSVVSFTEFEFPPQMAVSIQKETLLVKPLSEDSPLLTGNTRTQDQKTTYRPNGSLYVSWIESFTRLNSFYKGKVRGFCMLGLLSIDIDTLEDLEYARMIALSNLNASDFV